MMQSRAYNPNPLEDWFKAMVVSLLMSIATFAAILRCCGCCFILCRRILLNRLITTALTREDEPPKISLVTQPSLQAENMDSDDESEDEI